MNKDVRYRIVRIEAKKQGNPYHEMMTGKPCVVVAANVGYRGCLVVQTLEDSCYPRWFSTSPVRSVVENGNILTIETENTIYFLEEENVNDLS